MEQKLQNSRGWQLNTKHRWKSYFIHKLVLIVFAMTVTTISYSQVAKSDSLALVDLYNSTHGASWTNKTNWLVAGQSVSTWYGVTITGKGRVTQLKLTQNNLVGTIPSSIGNLTALTKMDLWSNKLSGSIPSSIGNLTALTYLSFDTNQLTGLIPTEIGNLTNLTFFDPALNQLSGTIPSTINNLTKLTYLNTGANQFTFAGMEEMVQTFSGLGSSNFGYTPQANINITLKDGVLSVSAGGTLSNNTYTWYKNGTQVTQVTGDSTYTPTTLGSYYVEVTNSVASALTLTSNTVTISQTAFQTDSLALVDLYNSTNGANWTNNANWLTGNVSTWYGVTFSGGRVTQLNFSNNLVGTIPSSIGNLTALQYLYLTNNKLSGEIPSSIGNLTSLIGFNVNGNQLSGAIPSTIGKLTSIIALGWDHNQLSGTIPKEIGNMTSLQRLYLNDNQLSGAIPSTINSLALTLLELQNNLFTFDGLEQVVQDGNIKTLNYSPQTSINITLQDSVLSVSVGGTPSNNTYTWYQDGIQVKQVIGDSTFTLNGKSGSYYATVTNSIATALTLTSNTLPLVVTGVVEKNETISVYPTLVKESLNIKLPDNTTAAIAVYDLSGRPMLIGKELNEKISQVHVGSFSQGMYLLKVQDYQTHQLSTFKFIKE